MAADDTRGALRRNRDFVRLWAGHSISQLGSQITLLALPLVAVAGLFAVERESAVLDTVKAWLLLRRTRGETRERLRRSRSELADVLDEINDWLNAPGTPAPSAARTPY